MRRGGTWIQRWRVPLGFVCAAVFLFFARPTPTALAAGAFVSVLGLAIRAWAAGHIRKNAQLATSGPYAFTRNPLYFGSFLLGLGFTIASGRWYLAVLFAALFIASICRLCASKPRQWPSYLAMISRITGVRFHCSFLG